jgi:hypothetical protein
MAAFFFVHVCILISSWGALDVQSTLARSFDLVIPSILSDVSHV